MELSMVMRWRGQEVTNGLRHLQRDLDKTGETGKTTTSRLIDGTKNLERATTSLERTNQGLLKVLRDIGSQRPGEKIAPGIRKTRDEVEKTISSFDRLKTAGRLAAGIVAGSAAAKFVIAEPLKKTMDYGMRLAGMANTAYSDRDVAGRKAGKKELDSSIVNAVRTGGGTRDQAAGTLDTLIASGAMSIKDAMGMLPTLTKAATASGADPDQLANIAIRAMQTFKIGSKDLPKVIDMAITAGQEGGFELKDMAKWLPQQMASARLSGMSGTDGLAKLLAANQASAITAGSKDEAGNNLVNLLAKINSQDTAKDAHKLGIDLSGTLAAARSKGTDSIDAFLNLTEMTVGKDKKYQNLRKNAASAKGDDARANFESQADILQGSSIGKLVQDRQALMALVGLMNNRKYVQDVEGKVKSATGTADKNYAVMADEMGFKSQQREQEKEIATYTAFEKLAPAINAVNDHLIASAREYPNFTAGMTAATTALGALTAAALTSGAANLVMGGGGAAVAGGVAAAGSGALSRLAVTGAFAAGMPFASFAAGAPMMAAGGLLAAGAVGYGAGSLINKGIEGTEFSESIGRSIAMAMAAMGNKEAKEALKIEIDVKNGNIVAAVTAAQDRKSLRN
ncbi:MAG: phage tail tape measure protein [Undibacterium sp.]|uniref:phage tail tape measure protein n=1 Tax=Undibacterium sp. TaxID=1914977 RepID=UPI002716B59D|nr:phage tail tape measure protein [Undibacterium sp.]MDO8654187.1 phage tail tape measure protein [Undibacterium sp.]